VSKKEQSILFVPHPRPVEFVYLGVQVERHPCRYCKLLSSVEEEKIKLISVETTTACHVVQITRAMTVISRLDTYLPVIMFINIVHPS